MTHHSYNDEGISFSKETDWGAAMERKMQVKTLCPVHILAIGRRIAGDIKFHDMARFPCNVTVNL